MMVESPAMPLNGHLAYASRDLNSFRSYLSSSYCEHRVFSRSNGMRLNAVHHKVLLSSMSLNYLQYGAEVDIDPGALETFYLLEMPSSGQTVVSHGGQTIVNKPGTAVLVSPSRTTQSVWSEDCGQRMIKISRAAIEQQAAHYIGRALDRPLVFSPMMDLGSDPGQSIHGLCMFLYQLYESAPGPLTDRRVSTELERALISALLLGQPSNYSEAFELSTNEVMPRHVRRAVKFIEVELMNDISLDEIVRVSGVSSRALYSGFSRFLQNSPQAYIRDRRLDRCRRDLLNAGRNESVKDIAERWNFNHLGRFAADYRARFGELPSTTLPACLQACSRLAIYHVTLASPLCLEDPNALCFDNRCAMVESHVPATSLSTAGSSR